ncbi:MAG: DUF928 domain-containing protein [Snowella sp.]|nr:DUF928 domain-containing protein [Snowella sp.]
MAKRNLLKQSAWLWGMISCVAIAAETLPLIAHAQSTDNDFPIAPDRRKPGGSRPGSDTIEAPMRRKPGGSRDLLSNNTCRFDPQQLTALVPQSLNSATASASPTLFFAVPIISQDTSIELVVRDETDQLIYEKFSSGLGQAGILSVTLPKNMLKPSGEYHWYLSVICNQRDRAYDYVVEGIVQRVAMSPSSTQNGNWEEQIKQYQAQNLWQDKLAVLADLKRQRPNDPQTLTLWQETLRSVNLDEAIAVSPLL